MVILAVLSALLAMFLFFLPLLSSFLYPFPAYPFFSLFSSSSFLPLHLLLQLLLLLSLPRSDASDIVVVCMHNYFAHVGTQYQCCRIFFITLRMQVHRLDVVGFLFIYYAAFSYSASYSSQSTNSNRYFSGGLGVRIQMSVGALIRSWRMCRHACLKPYKAGEGGDSGTPPSAPVHVFSVVCVSVGK